MSQPSPLLDLLRRRIVVAPMAGGATTTDLVIAAAGAGALGFLAAGYKTPAAMTAEITAVRGDGSSRSPPGGHTRRRFEVEGT